MKRKPPKPLSKPKHPVRDPKIHKGWRFFALYVFGRRRVDGQWVHRQGIPLEVLAKTPREAQKLFADYLGRTPPFKNVLELTEMIGTWQWIAGMRPRVVRDFEKVSQEKAWKRR